ncbi:hypothetical protein C8J57DRAFT_1231928 [Mycena rebaudengoi]|nr:hypothetical protein C8J57DRAFT_1231928 [Mycena rebaudengoi]
MPGFYMVACNANVPGCSTIFSYGTAEHRSLRIIDKETEVYRQFPKVYEVYQIYQKGDGWGKHRSGTRLRHGGLLYPTVTTFQTLAESREAENALKDEDRRQAIQELGCYQSEGQESNVDFDLVRYWAVKGLFLRTDPSLEKRTSGANDVQSGDEYPILSAQSFDPQNRSYGTNTAIEG